MIVAHKRVSFDNVLHLAERAVVHQDRRINRMTPTACEHIELLLADGAIQDDGQHILHITSHIGIGKELLKEALDFLCLDRFRIVRNVMPTRRKGDVVIR